jgi:hypothetical protein
METEKKFSSRRFVSVMTLCTFVITGISGLVMLLSEGPPSPSGITINWKEMHEIGCIFFVIFGVWHLILNFKVLCSYFKGRERRFAFRMDWVIPVAISLVFFIAVSFMPAEKHEFKGKYPPEFYKMQMEDND